MAATKAKRTSSAPTAKRRSSGGEAGGARTGGKAMGGETTGGKAGRAPGGKSRGGSAAGTGTRARSSGAKGPGTTSRATGGGGGRSAGSGSSEGLFDRLKRDLSSVRDVFVEELDHVVDSAKKAADRSGIADPERIAGMEERLRERMSAARERLDETQQRIAETARRVQEDERVKAAAGAGLAALHGFASSLADLAGRFEQSVARSRPYASGDLAQPGSYACSACDAGVTLRKAVRLPLCPECGGGRFRRA